MDKTCGTTCFAHIDWKKHIYQFHSREDDHLWDSDPSQVNSVTDFYDKISAEK